ncbi:MAG: NAD(P)-binding domain-containing protein [Variovorax sp.]
MSSSPEMEHARRAELAVVGLGEIGGGLARYLAATGIRVAGFDIDAAARARAVLAGVLACDSLGDAVDCAPLVVTSLPSESALRAVYLDGDGLAAAGSRITTCDLSTVSVALAKALSKARTAAGAAHVEGALIGVGRDAEQGNVHLLLAGTDAAIDALAPLLRAAGRGSTRFAEAGHANLAKILNNGIGQATLAAIAEALALARAVGLPCEPLVEAMIVGRGAGYSMVLERHGSNMARDADGPGTAALALKDAQALAHALAEVPLTLPLLTATARSMAEAVAKEGCQRQAVALARWTARVARSGAAEVDPSVRSDERSAKGPGR